MNKINYKIYGYTLFNNIESFKKYIKKVINKY